ncbi:M48 family metallopeptidase [Hyphomonas sp. NPDC076900]|uniref:M48 metallopeptidase family protein n=1 Tax=Hyphomonas sp. NPDC076900 TaxID=3390570 RepID=UPI003D0465AF
MPWWPGPTCRWILTSGPDHRSQARQPRSIRTADLAHGWGSCSPKGNITINWQLIFAPRKVLEYVVLHELAHLKVRNHGPKFWRFLSTLEPDYQRSKTWLEKHQSTLSADFLRRG